MTIREDNTAERRAVPRSAACEIGEPKPALLSTPEAAKVLAVTPHTLEVWRTTGRHRIPYIKIGRLVRYRPADLDAWLTARTVDGEAV